MQVSNNDKNPPGQADRRLIELEIKASYTEDRLDRPNAVVVRQQNQIDLLVRELTAMKLNGPDGEPAASRSLRDELSLYQ